ncbi:Hemolysin-type calcium-binding repeat-containing protein [Paracoccus isoporae]|uniref:Hemolysin-type calcium-binding repeat-containing protein n=1 Tax=Paracoccus isoporae TaxID=591205 RepID=A0A1G7DPN3_9RHOB|nr:hypothetical protein [Paracoccus isoporae]SDE53116.1 Hemolysin-type calcium-binding repeat-containing protein [Paracoccus isoporae]
MSVLTLLGVTMVFSAVACLLDGADEDENVIHDQADGESDLGESYSLQENSTGEGEEYGEARTLLDMISGRVTTGSSLASDSILTNGDHASLPASQGGDELIGTNLADTIIGTGFSDYIEGDPVGEAVGDDVLLGGGGDDWINAGAGNDAVSGDTGDDTIFGGAGADTLLGGAGDDEIHIGALDHVDGGAGHDVLILDRTEEGVATISNFDASQDRIQITLDPEAHANAELTSLVDGSGHTIIEVGGTPIVRLLDIQDYDLALLEVKFQS